MISIGVFAGTTLSLKDSAMVKLFIDTNVLLDVILRRESFFKSSADVWAICETGRANGFISAISLNNIHYVARKFIGAEKALEGVRLVLEVFSVVPLDNGIFQAAIDAPFRDFEDDIQLASALRCGADYVITRDLDHYPSGLVRVVPPVEYIGSLHV